MLSNALRVKKMVVITKGLVPDNTSDTAFRAWGSQISDSLTKLGITKTTDTGQIDWTGVGAPSANSFSGYEVRQFTDALQTTCPIYIKVRYGASNYQNLPRVEISVSSSTNGSGLLTGLVSTPISVVNFPGSYQTTIPQLCIFSGTSSRMTLGLFANYDPVAQFFNLERTKNNLGQDTSEGVLLTAICYGIRQNQFIPAAGTALIVPSSTDTGFFTPDRGTSSTDGSSISLYPNYFFRGGTQLNPTLGTLCYFNADAVPGTINPIPMYGSTHNYYFTGTTNISARGAIPNTSLAILYE